VRAPLVAAPLVAAPLVACHTAVGGPIDTPTYDQTVLQDHPIAFWAVHPRNSTEVDLAGANDRGVYRGGQPATTVLPNGDSVAVFDGRAQSLSVPSSPAMSIATTGYLTWEAWIRPDTLEFPTSTSDGYVNFLGKCATTRTCEWEGRIYNVAHTNPDGRCTRLSAYVFNASGGLGAGAFWQQATPTCDALHAGEWLHVVAEYSIRDQPTACPNAASFPGSIDIWLNGVKWDQAAHAPTGCMSQPGFEVRPAATTSAVTIGSVQPDSWFKGAIGKVALYDHRLSDERIALHFQAMTGRAPTGSCAATCRLAP
jgi:hypothetical protein